MSDLTLSGPLSRDDLLRELRAQLHSPPLSLRVLAADLLGLESRIDWVCLGPDRHVVLVFVVEGDDALEALANALAQRAWVAPRLRDWLQLAPDSEVISLLSLWSRDCMMLYVPSPVVSSKKPPQLPTASR